MASVSFTKNSGNFNMAGDLISFKGSATLANGTAYGWVGAGGNGVDFEGTGFTAAASGTPTGGTVNKLKLDLGDDNFSNAEVQMSGLSFDLTALAPIVSGSLSVEEQNNLYWRTVLSGADKINFGSTATAQNFHVDFAGDGRNVSAGISVTAGDDTMSGDAGKGALVQGDVIRIDAGGVVYGGNDTITLNNTTEIAGDALSVSGYLRGGNDTLKHTSGGGYGPIAGDAFTVEATGTVIGGNDAITLASQPEGFAFAYGDASDVFGQLAGGNDTMTGSATGDYLIGDAAYVYSGASVTGGNDTIHGGGGQDFIFGDWLSAPANTSGGNDKLFGDAGDDYIAGQGGDDLIDGGTGNDMLEGGLGNDTFVFNTVMNAATNVDEVFDFTNAMGNDDRFLLDDAVFAGISGSAANGGELLSGFFKNTAKGAIDGNDHIIYVQSSGNLYYDSNGSEAGGRTLFAHVDAGTALTFHDFFVN